MVELSNMGDKLVDNVDKISGVLVFLSMDGVNNVVHLANAAISGTPGAIHMPDLKLVAEDIIGNSNTRATGLIAIAAWLGKEIGLPHFSKVSIATSKAFIGVLGGLTANSLIWRTSHGSEGSYESGIVNRMAPIVKTSSYGYGG